MRYVTRLVRAEPCSRIARKRISCASAVPASVSAASEATDFQPGAWSGRSTSASGSRATRAAEHRRGRERRPARVAEALLREDPAQRVGERGDDDRDRPGHEPPADRRLPERQHVTPAKPISTPTSRRRDSRSAGSSHGTSNALKIGTVEFATAAIPESMCCSPHAISVNGIAPLTTPIAKPAQPAARSSAKAARLPERRDQESREQDARDRRAGSRSSPPAGSPGRRP